MRTASRKIRSALILVVLLLLVVTLSLAGLRGWVAYQYRTARQALEQSDFARAGKAIDRCFQVWSRDPKAHLLAAESARRQNDYQAALTHLRLCRGKKEHAKDVAREYQLLDVQQGNLSEAGALFHFCSQYPDDPDTPLILEALIKSWLQLLESAAGIGVVIRNYESIAKEESSKRAGEVPLPLEPSAPRSVPIQVGCRQAVNLWLKLRTSPAEQARGLVWNGRLNNLVSDKSKAQADFRKALELDPKNFDARLFLAKSIAQESYLDAAAHLQTLWEQYPNNNSARYALAFVRRAIGEADKARPLLDALLADHPNDVMALILRGYVAIDMRQFDEAEQFLRRAVRLAPEQRECYTSLQSCLRLQGKIEEAEQCQERIAEAEAKKKRRHDELIQKLKTNRKLKEAADASRE